MRLVILSLAFASTLCAAEPRPTPDRGYVPPSGMVPDAETAIAIAVAIWKPIDGAEEIQAQRPFKAKLSKGVWHVEGLTSAWHSRRSGGGENLKDGR